jgi:hypothetical protein
MNSALFCRMLELLHEQGFVELTGEILIQINVTGNGRHYPLRFYLTDLSVYPPAIKWMTRTSASSGMRVAA